MSELTGVLQQKLNTLRHIGNQSKEMDRTVPEEARKNLVSLLCKMASSVQIEAGNELLEKKMVKCKLFQLMRLKESQQRLCKTNNVAEGGESGSIDDSRILMSGFWVEVWTYKMTVDYNI